MKQNINLVEGPRLFDEYVTQCQAELEKCGTEKEMLRKEFKQTWEDVKTRIQELRTAQATAEAQRARMLAKQQSAARRSRSPIRGGGDVQEDTTHRPQMQSPEAVHHDPPQHVARKPGSVTQDKVERLDIAAEA